METIGKGCFSNKLGQFACPQLDILLVEDPFRKAAKEPWHSILQHFAPRA